MSPRIVLDSRRDPTEIGTPFEGDYLEREVFADRLSKIIERLKVGAVLAIDAPWGEGKSWFGLHWQERLKREGYRTGFINAFANDYVEDPFLLVASELISATSDPSTDNNFISRTAKVAVGFAPLAARIFVNTGFKILAGQTDFAAEFDKVIEESSKSVSDEAYKWTERKLASHKKEKEDLIAFHKALSNRVSLQEKPTVIFVDELDRCKPSFAVSLLERLKHFFEVDNLIFVLLIDRSQLEKTIQGAYGQDIDAAGYLNKFIRVSVGFQRAQEFSQKLASRRRFIKKTLPEYKRDSPWDENKIEFISFCSVTVGLSLREIQKAIDLLMFTDTNSQPIAIYLACIKVRHPDLFTGLASQDAQSHYKCMELMGTWTRELKTKLWYKSIIAWHNALSENFSNRPSHFDFGQTSWIEEYAAFLFPNSEYPSNPARLAESILTSLNSGIIE